MNENKRNGKIYDSKIFWAIISVILSLIIWSYVSSVNGSIMEKTFSGIEVQFAGESSLVNQKGLSITNVETTSVSVRIRGSRANIGKLKATDIKAVIDVSKITQPNEMSWSYELVFPSYVDTNDITIISSSTDKITFSVVKNISKTVGVKGSFEGTIAEGCVAEELVFDPETVVITGPESIVSTIDYIWVSFGEGREIDKTYSVDASFSVIDKNGQPVSMSALDIPVNSINVTQPISIEKELPLVVNLIPGGGVTEDDCKITIEPESIIVAADSKLIKDKNSIVIASVDLAAFKNSYEQTFTIALDDGVENRSDVTEAKVKIEIPGVSVRTIRVSNISYMNCSSGYSASIVTSYVDITLRSKDASALAAVKPEDVSIIADLSDYGSTVGQVRVNSNVIISGGGNVGAVGDVSVTVNIQKN